MSVSVPSQIVFDLGATERVQIRKNIFGARGRLLIPILGILGIAQGALSLYLHHNDWRRVLLDFAPLGCALALMLQADWWGWLRLLIKPQTTTVAFSATGLEIGHAGSSRKRLRAFVPFSAIRSVQMTSDALIIIGRWGPVALIPKRAFANDGDQLMKFFEAHLVGTRFLQRSSSTARMIVNTTSP